ncbi:phosphoglycerate kinase [bacterium BMS3Abin02]|nr:phosphoglycerate kinase [bacterium BMS3Abin02]HDL49089.1 phosphoglycerate kinase [Actinomycetota bacterium]
MARFLTLGDVDVAGCRVLVRSDLNVPLAAGKVADDFRIRASLPTIERLRKAGAVVVVGSHLGRPKGRDPRFAMDPVAVRMAELGGFPVEKLDAVVGPSVQAAVQRAEPGDVILLENTRFEPGETKNDPVLAEGLARLADLFVLDAFGTAHRAHASTVGVAERLRSVAGPLLVKEVEALTRLLEAPERPFTVVLGGAKVSDKLGVIRSLLPKVDMMLIGGGMCFTLLAAEGYEIGDSLFEEDRLEEVSEILASPYGDRISLPLDIVVADRFAADARAKTVDRDDIPSDWMGLDIGPETIERFTGVVHGSHSVFWNGPMGVFEWERFRAGTEQVARSLGDFEGFSVVGGGDSVAAMRLLGLADTVSHLSTGGGAGLEMLEGKTLPGVAVLERWADGS